jgi:hypothetical protein
MQNERRSKPEGAKAFPIRRSVFSRLPASALKIVSDGSNGRGQYHGAELVYDWCTRVGRREGVARTESILAKQSHPHSSISSRPFANDVGL